ncbi:MAG: UDP-galactopyranose mutase [Halobacteriovoraceae bacterium]|jgi:UDP-galactopyranose mutase|nr:UDP-galactopyranose mutase [Halobacteriovoraceae bacterium]
MNFDNIKFLVVGAGFFGSVIAERIASQLNKKVLMIDSRDHIGGNSFSYKDQSTEIEIHKYGSHIFHTSDKEVWDYINQFTKFNSYKHKVKTLSQGQIYDFPINLNTINHFFNKCLSAQEAPLFLKQQIATNSFQKNSSFEHKAMEMLGEKLYRAFIYGYTKKQWGISPRKLPKNIINRVPLRFSTNDKYFNDTYQGIPLQGYGKLFDKMLNHKNISIKLNTDFFEIKSSIPKDITIIYSGPIDRFFQYKYGHLKWRTCRFELEKKDVNLFQNNAVLNFADEEIAYTRIHEYKHYHPERVQSTTQTIIAKEFPSDTTSEGNPFYPINTKEDQALFKMYLQEAKNEKNTIFGGRLATYTYLDMHQVINSALSTFKKLSQQ